MKQLVACVCVPLVELGCFDTYSKDTRPMSHIDNQCVNTMFLHHIINVAREFRFMIRQQLLQL